MKSQTYTYRRQHAGCHVGYNRGGRGAAAQQCGEHAAGGPRGAAPAAAGVGRRHVRLHGRYGRRFLLSSQGIAMAWVTNLFILTRWVLSGTSPAHGFCKNLIMKCWAEVSLV